MKTAQHLFKTFPEFSELTLGDKDRYENMIAHYPPFADYSFPALMNQWSVLDSCKIAQLHDNLVIYYWMPGLDEYSGLSILGTKKVDESVAIVLDWLKEKGDPAKLVHVPEFVVSNMRYPELYTFVEERDFDECVVPVTNLNELGRVIVHKRWKIRRFMAEVGKNRVALESLDLNISSNQEILLNLGTSWKGGLNSINTMEQDIFRSAIKNAEAWGLENVCLSIDGHIQGFLLYELPSDPNYATIQHARFNYAIPHLFEFAAYRFAQWFTDQQIKYLNLECDLGNPVLRATKLALGPANFFRKYTLAPRDK